MGDRWVSIAEAAATMKIHPRTVERRAAAGKVESRRNDDGQVQVYLNLPDPEPTPPPAEPVSAGAFETVREMADRQVDIAAGSASALVRAAQAQAMRAEHQLDLARQEAGRSRREMQMAMALVAVMLLGVIVAVGWCTHTITADRDQAVAATEAARQANDELRHVRDQLADATKSEGELAAYKHGLATVIEQTRPVPATRPATFVERMSQVFAD